MSRRSRVITMASDGLSPRPGVRWPTTLVAPPTGMAIAPIAPAQFQHLPDLVLGFGKGDAVDDGPTRPKRRRSQSSRLWPTLARRRGFRVPADQAMVRQPGRADAGEDVGEGRVVRRRRLADPFTEEIPTRVGQVRLDRLLAPAIPSTHRLHPSLAHRIVCLRARGVKAAAEFPARSGNSHVASGMRQGSVKPRRVECGRPRPDPTRFENGRLATRLESTCATFLP